mmetsp:Transcript_7761/g.25710  ORF Transcript_7761/g.25710 Transcript_7761/m.25710 type:complete len:327 (+) Transcript_7761:132-1112(+)
MFTLKEGFLEALVRGMKAELLVKEDYIKLRQCDSLVDLKLYLVSRGYHSELHSEIGPISPTRLVELCAKKLVKGFRTINTQASEPLTTLLNYVTHRYMIDNVILIMTGSMRGRSFTELLSKCHPLGMFESMENLLVANDLREIHRLVLIDTPISTYFNDCLKNEKIDETNIEFIRNSVYKAYLEDFVNFCIQLGDECSDLMQLLVFEADRRVINITLSSFGTELTVSDKLKLFPSFGSLNPSGQLAMAQCTNSEEFHNMLEVMAPYGSVLSRFKGAEPRTLDKVIVLSCCHVLKLTSHCRSLTKKNIFCVKVYFSSDQDTQFSWHT